MKWEMAFTMREKDEKMKWNLYKTQAASCNKSRHGFNVDEKCSVYDEFYIPNPMPWDWAFSCCSNLFQDARMKIIMILLP